MRRNCALFKSPRGALSASCHYGVPPRCDLPKRHWVPALHTVMFCWVWRRHRYFLDDLLPTGRSTSGIFPFLTKHIDSLHTPDTSASLRGVDAVPEFVISTMSAASLSRINSKLHRKINHVARRPYFLKVSLYSSKRQGRTKP